MLLGTGGLVAVITVLFVMEQELSRIGFFTRVKLPSFQLPNPIQKDSPEPTLRMPPSPPVPDQSLQPKESAQPSTQVAGQAGHESASSRTTEDISHDDRKRLTDLTTSRPKEDLSHDDRKQLDDILRSR
jgi:hypothetical protein